ATHKTNAQVEKDRADGIAKRLEVLEKDKAELEEKLAEMTAKAGELERKAREANEAAEKKLAAVIDKSTGSVSTEGDEIRLQLVDKVLFAIGDDQLTDKGKAVLAKVAKALKEIPDKQIWVQGHTDDTPIAAPPPPKTTGKKGKAAPDPPRLRYA